MFSRRNFLRRSALISLAPAVPAFVSRVVGAAIAKGTKDDRILVVIQLSGGNDGLNTVIPFGDELYRKYRRDLRIDSKDVIRLDDAIGLHPAMKTAGELFNDGRLAIVQGVGYPNPDRSHFRSMSIWHSARLNSIEHTGQGWLGRAVDAARLTQAGDPANVARINHTSHPDAVYVGEGPVPAAIIGRRAKTISLNNEREMMLTAGTGPDAIPVVPAPFAPTRDASVDLRSFVQGQLDTSFLAAQQFAESSGEDIAASSAYPRTAFGQRMKLIARMIRGGGATRIFYVEQGGYDTHASQRIAHDGLLRTFANSLKAFLDDMSANGLAERIAVVAFSEFGRRVEENASAGTDHGTAGPVFLAGASVIGGLHGAYPTLSDLDDGDLKVTTDFRSVYASVLTDWLNVEASEVLAGSFPALPLFRRA